MSDDREFGLTQAIGAVLAEFEQWVEGPDLLELPPLFDEAIHSAIGAFAADAVPPVLATCDEYLEKVRVVWKRFKEEMRGEEEPSLPVSLDFWRPFEGLLEAWGELHEGTPRRVESVKMLMDQKVAPVQICKILGLLDRFDRADLNKLEEEIAEPGKHTKDLVSPAEKSRRDRIAKESMERRNLWKSLEAKLGRLTRKGPESLEELLSQRVSGRQICQMLQITRADLAKQCLALDENEPPWEYKDVRTERAPQEHKILPEAEAELDATVGGGSMRSMVKEVIDKAQGSTMSMSTEQRVIFLHEQGFTNKQIKDTLEITGQRVSSILKKVKAS